VPRYNEDLVLQYTIVSSPGQRNEGWGVSVTFLQDWKSWSKIRKLAKKW